MPGSDHKPITTRGEYTESVEHLSSADIGDLWDEYFNWHVDRDPMDRWDRIEMIYAMKYPNNSDVPEIKARRRMQNESR